MTPTLSDLLTLAYGGGNLVLLVGYLPQVRTAWRDPYGARAIALTTWVLWTATAGVSTLYAALVARDRLFGLSAAANALGCAAVVAGAAWSRRRLMRLAHHAAPEAGEHHTRVECAVQDLAASARTPVHSHAPTVGEQTFALEPTGARRQRRPVRDGRASPPDLADVVALTVRQRACRPRAVRPRLAGPRGTPAPRTPSRRLSRFSGVGITPPFEQRPRSRVGFAHHRTAYTGVLSPAASAMTS